MPQNNQDEPKKPVHMNPFKKFISINIPNWLLRIEKLNDGDRILYGQLFQHSGKKGLCWPKQVTLGKELLTSPDTINRRVQKLKRLGLIDVIRRGKKKSNIYKFCYRPELIEEGDLLKGVTKQSLLVSNSHGNVAELPNNNDGDQAESPNEHTAEMPNTLVKDKEEKEKTDGSSDTKVSDAINLVISFLDALWNEDCDICTYETEITAEIKNTLDGVDWVDFCEKYWTALLDKFAYENWRNNERRAQTQSGINVCIARDAYGKTTVVAAMYNYLRYKAVTQGPYCGEYEQCDGSWLEIFLAFRYGIPEFKNWREVKARISDGCS